MNRFGKIIFALAFVAAVLGLNLRAAEPAAEAVAAAHEAAHAEAAGPIVAPIAQVLFYIGTPPTNAVTTASILGHHWPKQIPALPVSNSIICTWIVALVILLIVRLSTWNIKMIPSGMQNILMFQVLKRTMTRITSATIQVQMMELETGKAGICFGQ